MPLVDLLAKCGRLVLDHGSLLDDFFRVALERFQLFLGLLEIFAERFQRRLEFGDAHRLVFLWGEFAGLEVAEEGNDGLCRDGIALGSPGTGATAHLAGELFKMLAAVNIVHVPYKGASAALVGVMSGEIEMFITGLSSAMPYVKQKQLRILGVSSANRVTLIADVPSIAETLPGYDVTSWYAVLAPADTPRTIIERLHQLSTTAVTTPDIQSRLTAAGVEVDPLTPQQLGAKLARDHERWGRVVIAAGMKPN